VWVRRRLKGTSVNLRWNRAFKKIVITRKDSCGCSKYLVGFSRRFLRKLQVVVGRFDIRNSNGKKGQIF
jgi:hypothetical protein